MPMRARRRTFLLVALLCLVAPAGPAFGEGAWMLWGTIKGGLYNNIAAPVSASDTKEACERALSDQVAKQVATAKKSGVKVKATETLVTVHTRDKRGAPIPLTTQYACLPENVNPRKV